MWCFLGINNQSFGGEDNDYYFDPSLIKGNSLSNSELQQFDYKQKIPPGDYKVELYVNNTFITQVTIIFKYNLLDKIQPCLQPNQIYLLGFKKSPINIKNENKCYFLSDIDSDIISSFNYSQLKLNLTIPQAKLKSKNTTIIQAESLDSGETMLFANYNINQYHVNYSDNIKDINSTYLDVKGGFNLGLWNYRQDSHYSYSNSSGGQWKTTRRYIQRAIYNISSQLLIGEGFTSGQLLPGMGFKGIQLSSDDRMLPNNIRGYAPLIQGIANSNAEVKVWQGSNIIYTTTVPAGPFTIDDLYSTNYAGDLRVEVIESNGTKSSFIVPFSAVPESVRPGYTKYAVTAGKTRFIGDNNLFSEFVIQHGLTNSITLNIANQLAKGYQAVTMGGVYTAYFGALSFNTTFSHAELPKNSEETGWKFHASYSKTFQPTDTSVTLSSYHYSTSGFRSLSDTLNARYLSDNNVSNWQDKILRQRSRFDIVLNQNLKDYGNVGLSASRENYHNSNGTNDQLQFTWSKILSNGISSSVSIAKMSNSLASSWYYDGQNADKGKSQLYISLGLSIPLGNNYNSPNLSFSTLHYDGENNYQTSLSGLIGSDNQPISYGLSYSSENQISQGTLSGSFQTQLPYTNIRATTSKNKDYWQVSGGIQGGVVAHRGGITLGPYLGDTFALIDAPDAKGARVANRNDVVVDRFGYAIVPSLVPYQYNTLLLGTENVDSRVEINTPDKRVAPYSGAMVRVKYKTSYGRPVLVTLLRKDKDSIPMGSQAFDEDNKIIGMVGQGNQFYFRANKEKGTLNIFWGESLNQQCTIDYELPKDNDQPLIQLMQVCN
ncbi:fimbrial usher protein [Moellerella wisconsensis ATCC 35017]|uniref:Fimbrial usher protein n=1 Tax=Moellerella wisconsensis ATCC 35017 TaxID=1354267 RepID=A0A0N0ZA15_9GAMM|nr:fimbrial usher protein [Moellerella wisconsensis ATCC 35017]